MYLRRQVARVLTRQREPEGIERGFSIVKYSEAIAPVRRQNFGEASERNRIHLVIFRRVQVRDLIRQCRLLRDNHSSFKKYRRAVHNHDAAHNVDWDL